MLKKLYSTIKLKTFLAVTATCVLATLTACSSPTQPAQTNLNETELLYANIPNSPEHISGQLKNGLTYFVRSNKRPENFAELRLIVKAGSIQEDEAQLGFAHFVEHMAFNGTSDFKKREIIEFVESIGMQFGAHLNAYTSFNETVYQLRVPLNQKGALETGIHILENWAHKISFEHSAIDDERGVILEEKRSRKGVQERISEQTLPILMQGTNYAERLPIGSQEIISHGQYRDLERYYRTWYRADLMTVVAVGDFNTLNASDDGISQEDVISLIKQYFNKVAKPKALSKAASEKMLEQALASYTEPAVALISDKELTSSGFYLAWRQPEFSLQTNADIRQSTIQNLLISSINARFAEAVWQPDTPYVNARLSFNRNYRLGHQFILSARVKPNELASSMKSTLASLYSAIDKGISLVELNRQSQIMLEGLNKSLSQEATYSHGGYVEQYKNHALYGDAIPSLQYYVDEVKRILPTITQQDLSQQLAAWIKTQNAVIVATLPESELPDAPNKNELLNIFNEASSLPSEAYTPPAAAPELMSTIGQVGTVLSKSYIEKWQAHEWKLSNGVRVLLKPTKFKDNEIRFWAYSPGGYSKFDDEAYARSFGMMSSLSSMGLGELDTDTYNQYMQDKRFTFSTQITSYSESAYGNTTQQELLPFMQTMHLNFVAPRKDPSIFTWLKGLYEPQIKKRLNTPQNLFYAKIREATNAGDPRAIEFDLDALAKQELDTIFNIREQSFANAADFTFVFVGDIELATMEEMLKTYVATLPSSDKFDTISLLPDYDASGDITIALRKGSEPKANVIMNMWGDAKWTAKGQLVFGALKSALQNRLLIRLREELGGVYGINVGGNFQQWPYQENNIQVSFVCDPERIDELKHAVEQVFSEFIAGNIEANSLDNYKTRLLTNREKQLKENGFWMNRLMTNALPYQTVPLDEYPALVQSIELDDVVDAAQQYLVHNNRYFATLRPE